MTTDAETNLPDDQAQTEALDDTEGVDGAHEADDQVTEAEDDGEPDEASPDAEADETEEVEHEGKKYPISKALRPLLMMQADYTQKTQTLAEQRRTVESQAQDLTQRQQAFAQATQQHAEAQDKLVAARAELVSLDQNLAAYDELIRAAETSGDFDQARRYRDLRGDLRDERVKVADAVKAHQDELSGHQQRALTQIEAQRQAAMEEGVRVLSQDPAVKLSKPVFDAVASHLHANFGIAPPELYQTLNDPRVFKVAKAFTDAMAENSKLKAENASLKKSGATSAARPAATVRGKSPAGKDPDKMTTAEWMARERQNQSRSPNGQWGTYK